VYFVQLIIWVMGLLALFYSAKHFPIIKNIILFSLFYYALVAFDISPKQAYFYLFGLMFGILIEFYLGKKFRQQSSSADVNGSEPGGRVSGFAFEVFSVALSGALFLAAILLSAAKGQIMGVAPLAVESAGTFTSKLTLAFSPLLSGSLGIIENYVWFGALIAFIQYKLFFEAAFLFLAKIPYAGIIFLPMAKFAGLVMPFLVTFVSFGVFHVVSYLFDWTKMIWASVMMALMVLSYFVSNRDMTAANLFHFSWNSNITARETLSIIG
jgi:hypothetical protein